MFTLTFSNITKISPWCQIFLTCLLANLDLIQNAKHFKQSWFRMHLSKSDRLDTWKKHSFINERGTMVKSKSADNASLLGIRLKLGLKLGLEIELKDVKVINYTLITVLTHSRKHVMHFVSWFSYYVKLSRPEYHTNGAGRLITSNKYQWVWRRRTPGCRS